MKLMFEKIENNVATPQAPGAPCKSVSQFMTSVQRIGTATATKVILRVFLLSIMAASAQAATWYVDSSVGSSGNGQSWSTAWKNLSNISGVSAGDIVYISGGPSGQTQSYSVSSWSPTLGSSAIPITYQIGQDSSHNGTALFSGTGTFFGVAPSNLTFTGNAGDGQMHFMLSGYSSIVPTYAVATGFHFAYVNLGTMNPGVNGGIFSFGEYVNTIEVDHLYCVVAGAADHFLTFLYPNGSTWDSEKVHDITVWIPWDSSGGNNHVMGADGISFGGSGVSVYNCNILGYGIPNYISLGGGQHQDGIQSLGGNYCKFYNNFFYNTGNSAIFVDPASGNVENFLVYNNIVSQIYSHGIYINMESDVTTANPVISGCVMANNIIVDMPNPYGGMSLFFGQAGGSAATYTGNIVANNIMVNSIAEVVTSGSATELDAVSLSASQAATDFVNYTQNNTNFNFHLAAAATALIGKGANESSYFTIDKDGNPRPVSGAWDIGPYQYSVASTNAVISATPSSLNFGSVASGVSATNTFTVQNIGGGTLAGTATVAAPFRIVSGGTYSLGSSQTQTVSVSYSPSGQNDSQVVTFTGGGGATATVSGSLLAILSGLSFESYAGVVSAPFTTNGGYVSQSVLATNVASGGSASYYFNITNAGQYIVEASVLAPNSGTKSFWVNMDALPVDPTMIWDIYPYSTNWQTVAVSWRGDSTTLTNDQYNPEIFNLTPGVHDLIIIGREANVGLGQITIAPYSASRPSPPSPPVNLRIVASE